MREGILFLALFAFIACSNSSSEVIDEKEQPKPEQQVDAPFPPASAGYLLTAIV